VKTPTREELRRYLQQVHEGYRRMERERAQTPWREPTDEEKLAFDRLMADVYAHRKGQRDSGLVEWYRALLRTRR
jgi:arsenate reductase-like glutaredoxin family protein